MSAENYTRIYPDALHFLDFADDSAWIQQLFRDQLNDGELERIFVKISADVRPGDGPVSKLRKIQQFLHDQTYHLSQRDRVKLFGYLAFSDIPYSESLILAAFQTIEEATRARNISEDLDTWLDDKAHSRCVGSKMGTVTLSSEHIDISRGKLPLQCAEEATIAATLALNLGAITADQIVFLVSPAHVMLYVRPAKELPKGALFDSKMLYLPKNLEKFGTTAEQRSTTILNRLGNLWSIVSPNHTSVYLPKRLGTEDRIDEEIWMDFQNFLSLR